MDIITIALIERYIDIPFDIVLFLNEFVKYEKLTNDTIRDAVKLWFNNRQLCINRYGYISLWDVSKVTNMSWLFHSSQLFNEDISKWDVSNVINMQYMFYYAEYFNSDISEWNVSNVINMDYMFCGATSFNGDMSKWNVSNVQFTLYMFLRTEITKQHVENWNMSHTLKNNSFKN